MPGLAGRLRRRRGGGFRERGRHEGGLRGPGNVRFLHRDFDGFEPRNRFAVAKARHDRVLNLDADEVVTPELSAELAGLAARDFPSAAGYTVPRRLVFPGRRIGAWQVVLRRPA